MKNKITKKEIKNAPRYIVRIDLKSSMRYEYGILENADLRRCVGLFFCPYKCTASEQMFLTNRTNGVILMSEQERCGVSCAAAPRAD